MKELLNAKCGRRASHSPTEYKDLEDMVYRIHLTCKENFDRLDKKSIAASSKGFILQPAFDEISDLNLMLKSLFPKEVKVLIIFDDIRIKTNLTNDTTNNWFEEIILLHKNRFYSFSFRLFGRSSTRIHPKDTRVLHMRIKF